MKLDNMNEEDVKKLKSSLYKLIDNELKFYNFKDCEKPKDFYKLAYNAHVPIVSLVIGFFTCYVLYVDMNFNIIDDGIPLSCDIEKDLINKYFEVWKKNE